MSKMDFDKFMIFIGNNLDVFDIQEIKYIINGKYNNVFKSLNDKYKAEKNHKVRHRLEKIIIFLEEFIQDYKKNSYKYSYEKAETFEQCLYWFEFYIKNKFLVNAKEVLVDVAKKFPESSKEITKLEYRLNSFEKKFSSEYSKIRSSVDKNNKLKHIELLVGQGQFGEAMHEAIKYLQEFPNDAKVKQYLKKIDELKSSNALESIDVNYDFFEKVGLLNLNKKEKLGKADLVEIYGKMKNLAKMKDYEAGLQLIKYLRDKFKLEDTRLLKYYNIFLDIKAKKQKIAQEEEYNLELKSLKLLYKNKQYQDAILKANTILKKYPLIDKKYIFFLISQINKDKSTLLKSKKKSKFEQWIETININLATINRKGLFGFYEKMSWFLRAKMDLKLTLQVIYYQSKDAGVKKFVKNILEGIDSGIKISEILRWYPIVSRLDVSLIKIGETTGKLGDMFQNIYAAHKQSDDRRKKIKGVMIYPIVVVTITLGIFVGLLIFIVPKFSSFYGSMGMDLPALTVYMLNASDFLVHKWWILIIVIVLFLAFLSYFKRTPYGRYLFSILAIRLPIVKLIVFKKYVIYFSSNISLLLRSGINLLEALDLVIYGTDNNLFKDEYRRIRFELETGVSFSKSVGLGKLEDIAEYNNVYIPIDLAYAIDIGEKTGQLGDLLNEVSMRYDDDLQQLIKNLQSLMEPFIIVLLGAVVLVFVMSIFLPLINMYNVVGKMGGL